MSVKCFDCGANDWMRKFHHVENRSFCDQCYEKRMQPERSKREDSQLTVINAVSKEIRKREDRVIDEMRCSKLYGNIEREVQ